MANPKKHNNLESWSSFSDPALQRMKQSEAKRIIDHLLESPLEANECGVDVLPSLIRDDVWLEKKSYLTSRFAQRFLDIGDFHSRWPDVKQELKKSNLPYIPIQAPKPDSSPRSNLYFLARMDEGATCSPLSITK